LKKREIHAKNAASLKNSTIEFSRLPLRFWPVTAAGATGAQFPDDWGNHQRGFAK